MPSKKETVNNSETDLDDPGCCNIDLSCNSTGELSPGTGCLSLSKVKDILECFRKGNFNIFIRF